MNLKRIWFTLAVVMGLTILQPLQAHYYDFQVRSGGYFYTSKQAREAFKRGSPVIELEGSAHFAEPWVWLPWKAWVNVSFMLGHGDNERLGRTSSNLTTLSFGLKHSWMLDCYGGTFYLGLGPSLSWLRMKPHDSRPEGFWDGRWHGHRKVSKKNFGAVAKAGYQMKLWGWVLADVFADYQILAFHYKDFSKKNLHGLLNNGTFRIDKHDRRHGHHRLDLGGFTIGGALGYAF